MNLEVEALSEINSRVLELYVQYKSRRCEFMPAKMAKELREMHRDRDSLLCKYKMRPPETLRWYNNGLPHELHDFWASAFPLDPLDPDYDN